MTDHDEVAIARPYRLADAYEQFPGKMSAKGRAVAGLSARWTFETDSPASFETSSNVVRAKSASGIALVAN
jgi:hypothetical protein